jgi:hypothetical protein
MSVLLKRKNVRMFALALAAALRPGHKFTRVSKSFVDSMEYLLREQIKQHIKHLPSVGKTIK